MTSATKFVSFQAFDHSRSALVRASRFFPSASLPSFRNAKLGMSEKSSDYQRSHPILTIVTLTKGKSVVNATNLKCCRVIFSGLSKQETSILVNTIGCGTRRGQTQIFHSLP